MIVQVTSFVDPALEYILEVRQKILLVLHTHTLMIF